jgi:phosphohistidine phosphatase
MKHLLLVRHAKSDWSGDLSDHDRPLNDRGRRDVPEMADALRERGVQPDRIVSSSALRAFTTAFGLAEGLGFIPSEIERSRDLYLANPPAILQVVRSLDDAADTAIVVGHNPGMHETVCLLCSEETIGEFPTLAVAHFTWESPSWREIDFTKTTLVEFLAPKKLAEESD